MNPLMNPMGSNAEEKLNCINAIVITQEESRNISDNVTWGKRKRFADGKVYMPYKIFLGYDKGEDDLPVVNEKQAVIVRRIYREFMNGHTASGIAKMLTAEGIPTPTGKTVWSLSTVNSILRNEKFCGSAVLQKSYTVDFLSHKVKKNEGEVPQYYVPNSHEPIIAPEEWEAVQEEIRRRKEIGPSYSGSGEFASKIICGDCGAFFGIKTWHSTDKYCRKVWRCNAKYGKEHICRTPHFSDEEIKERFIKAYNRVFDDREDIIESCELLIKLFTDTADILKEITRTENEINLVTEMIEKLIRENASKAEDQNNYREKYDILRNRYEEATDRYNELISLKAEKDRKRRTVRKYINALKNTDEQLTEFDNMLFRICVENITAGIDGTLEFRFCDGKTVKI